MAKLRKTIATVAFHEKYIFLLNASFAACSQLYERLMAKKNID